jgi:SAM-dependent methyltransferase
MTTAGTPYAQAMLDYWRGSEDAAYTIHREDGFFHSFPVAASFALDRCSGKVLDLGAGAGRHSLALQARGFVVTALESESELVGIMAERGVADAVAGSVSSLTGRQFDTILMLMNGFGLVGTPSGATAFFQHARKLLSHGGQILCDSLDVRQTKNPLHLAYQATNVRNGRAAGQMRFWIEYGGEIGKPFDWLHIDFAGLQSLAQRHGVSAEMLAGEESGHYLARLIYVDSPID